MRSTEIKKIHQKKLLCNLTLKKDGIELQERGFILDMSKKFIYLRETSDFYVYGYKIIPDELVTNYRCNISDKAFTRIIKKEGIIKEIYNYEPIALTSFRDIFNQIRDLYGFCIIESVSKGEEFFAIGEIRRVGGTSVSIHYFNVLGKLDKKPTTIPYDEITTIEFDSNYINTFIKYIRK